MPNLKKKRVFVGLSGGVDSAVAAALLKKQGYNVAGVFMRFWRPRIDADLKAADLRGWENSCCSAESEAAARLIAGKLEIPFYVFNFEREFKKAVVDYFLCELRAGRTPNPCVVCNPQIKFGLFLERAKKLSAEFVATGHYARLSQKFIKTPPLLAQGGVRGGNFGFGNYPTSILPLVKGRRGIVKLFAAKDKQKDQSYFLHRLDQAQLSKIIFPLAGYTKEEVYRLAKKWRLPHQAHQSFDICFIEDYGKFLAKYLKLKPGKIVDISKTCHLEFVSGSKKRFRNKFGMTKNTILGQHQGLPFYTIGQRASIGGPGPFFVVKKDTKKNILYVSNKEKDLYQKEMKLENVNWINGKTPRVPFRCKIKIRYGAKSEYGLIRANGSIQKLEVLFDKPQRAITPGQSAVFYSRGGEVLGGGIIKGSP